MLDFDGLCGEKILQVRLPTEFGLFEGELENLLKAHWTGMKAEYTLTGLDSPQRCLNALYLLIMFVDVENSVEQMIKT